MKELTKAEEQVMQVLWKKEKAFVKELIQEFKKPKPAYNTVSTIIRILEKKGFVSHKAFGKTHEYFPIVKKEEYKKGFLKKIKKNYFSNSFKQMVSFLSKDENISIKELDEMIKILEEEKQKK
ncbi:MAG: BlaI/MecI/CopY family transcriptional regulator [Bacteroidota bacterium]|nr:BlaI/MecI/CopY family transcriptional regulator [Bacteroidota bacterium]